MTVEKILLEFDPELQNILPALQKISAAFGYVSEHNASIIAEYFKTNQTKVYETASFYDLVNTQKQPRLVIRVCSGTNCAIGKSFEIIKEIENSLHIKANDESDPNIKLEIVSCVGHCGDGPIMLINDMIYQKVSKEKVRGIIEEWV